MDILFQYLLAFTRTQSTVLLVLTFLTPFVAVIILLLVRRSLVSIKKANREKPQSISYEESSVEVGSYEPQASDFEADVDPHSDSAYVLAAIQNEATPSEWDVAQVQSEAEFIPEEDPAGSIDELASAMEKGGGGGGGNSDLQDALGQLASGDNSIDFDAVSSSDNDSALHDDPFGPRDETDPATNQPTIPQGELQNYLVEGVNVETTQDCSAIVQARSFDHAKKLGEQRHMWVKKVSLHTEVLPEVETLEDAPPKPDQPESKKDADWSPWD